MLYYNIVFLIILVNVVNIKADCQKPKVGENRNLIDELGRSSFPNGTTVKIKCAIGYKAVNFRKSIQCIGDQWTEVQLQCEKKSCGSLPDILHGRYLFDEGVEFGAIVTAECDEGYMLFGPTTRRCLDGYWSDRAPTCEVKQCPEPPEIKNGELDDPVKELYEYGEAVTYKCNRGFTLIGKDTISCSEDGKFQPSPPQCLHISCGEPEIPNAIRIEGSIRKSYEYKASVRYRCDDKYRMEGSDYLVCEPKGWSPSVPKCIEIICQKPPNIDNGQFEPQQETYKYRDVVTYSCKEGFRINGESKTTCSNDDTFHPPPPTQCVEVTCSKLPSIENGQFEPKQDTYKYGQTVAYTCKDGFKINGASKITCSGDGNFQPRPPLCSEMTCSKPPSIENGKLDPEQDKYRYRQHVRYSCNEGFKIHGTSTLLCFDDGTFKPSPPQCLVVTCKKPDSIDNGHFSPQQDEYRYGQTVEYHCNFFSSMDGVSKLTCSEDGTFYPLHPTCHGPHPFIIFGVIFFGLCALLVVGICFGLCMVLAVALGVYRKKKKVSPHGYSGQVASKSEEEEL